MMEGAIKMNQLELTFKGFEGYESIRQEAHDFIQLSIPDDAMFVEVAVSEAINNAIKHGNNYDESKLVQLKLEFLDDRRLIVRVKDEGNGFRWDSRLNKITKNKESFLEESLDKDSGRGIYIIHQLMDYVTFNEAGNEILFMKLLKDSNDNDPNTNSNENNVNQEFVESENNSSYSYFSNSFA